MQETKLVNSSKKILLSVVALVAAVATGCAPRQPAAAELPFQAVVGEKALMTAVIEPAADHIWDAVGTIIDDQGMTDFQPETDEEWTAVRNASVVVAESGNLLMMGRRARDQGDWLGWSRDLIAAGQMAMNAAQARDRDSLFDAGGAIYVACRGCHESYWIAVDALGQPVTP